MNSFGNLFRVALFGESHGPGVGVTIDGCPAGLPLTLADFKTDLAKRKSGLPGTTPRVESDEPRFLTGVFQDKTTGAPLTIWFDNQNTRSTDYSQFTEIPRPGHADFVSIRKFGGHADYRGGGHFSGRLTLGLVAAGVVAKKLIAPMTCLATLESVYGRTDIDKVIEEMSEAGDSVGGIVSCSVRGVPVGLGEPFFESVEARLAHMVFSIPATRGIEFGTGFGAVLLKGSQHNDPFTDSCGTTSTNHAGGINGGITNGNEIVFRVPVKPTSSIKLAQETVHLPSDKIVKLEVEGRHDTCIALRIVPVIEAGTAIVMADLLLLAGQTSRIYGEAKTPC